MQAEIVIYFTSLVTEDNCYCRLVLKEWARDQLLECIHLAHFLVDQGGMLFENVQPLIQLCAELALSSTPEGRDDFSPPFSFDQVESLVWLLENDPAFFMERYAACSQQVLSDCIHSVQSLVSKAVCESMFVQPVLQARSDLLYLAKPQQPSPAINHLPSQESIPPLLMATSATAQYTQLSTQYYYLCVHITYMFQI